MTDTHAETFPASRIATRATWLDLSDEIRERHTSLRSEMRAIAITTFLVACSPAMQTPTPTTPLGPHDGADHGVAPSIATTSSKELPRPILLASRGTTAGCRVVITDGARIATSTDETRVAVIAGEELSIWNPRTCDATTHAVPDLVGSAFIGNSHELLVIQRAGQVALTRIARDGNARVAGTIAERPTRWATSPDGSLAVLGVTDEHTSSLAIWNLKDEHAPIIEVKLPVVEREIDGLAFSKDGKTAVITVPVFASRRDELAPRDHLAITYDTRTWRSKRKVVVSQIAAPRSLRVEGNAIVVDGRVY